MPLDDQLVTMSEKQLFESLRSSEPKLPIPNLNFQFLEGNFKMSER